MCESELKIDEYGTRCWYLNGLLHRTTGPAVEYTNGDRRWYQNGQLHRIDGPAIEFSNDDRSWFQNGKLHRIDGPAVEWTNSRTEYWIRGVQLNETIVSFVENGLLTLEEVNKSYE